MPQTSLSPAELLQNLIRFDTTNPPGNEIACIQYIDRVLKDAGIATQTYAKDPNRPNLIARLAGRGEAPPLLLYGHVDVVPTANQNWTHPPFEARIADGYIWGRGTLDMKGGVAMMLSAFLRAKAENASLPGDVIFLAVSDEEAGGDFGAKFIAEEHPDLLKGVRYAIGEFGGFSFYVAGRKFYPVQVAEKQFCGLTGRVTGPAGHGAMSFRGGAMAKMARVLKTLDENRLPVHITPAAQQMVEAIAAGLPEPMNAMVMQLLDPQNTDAVLDEMGAALASFEPLLHNTVNATMVQGGSKVNVIPGEIKLEFDARLLPGYEPADLVKELTALTGDDIEWTTSRFDVAPSSPDMGLFPVLKDILEQADPEGLPIPYFVFGVTDARFFSKLGIQTYGFMPMQLPADFNFISTIHAADERIPVDSVAFGADAVYQALLRFGEG